MIMDRLISYRGLLQTVQAMLTYHIQKNNYKYLHTHGHMEWSGT